MNILLLVCLCLYLCLCLACKPVLTDAFRIWGRVNITPNGNDRRKRFLINFTLRYRKDSTLGTRGFFSRLRLDASVSAMTEIGKRARKVSRTQGGKTHHLANNRETYSALILRPSLHIYTKRVEVKKRI